MEKRNRVTIGNYNGFRRFGSDKMKENEIMRREYRVDVEAAAKSCT